MQHNFLFIIEIQLFWLHFKVFCQYHVNSFLQDATALSTINCNHRRQDFSACTGLGVTFIINKENSVFC